MPEAGEAVKEALAIEAEAVEGVDAAQAEQKRGQSAVSLGLLIEAVRKERDSLDLLEEAIGTLRQSLDDRRHALEQQEAILNELIDALKS
jgi:hypothetical protein